MFGENREHKAEPEPAPLDIVRAFIIISVKAQIDPKAKFSVIRSRQYLDVENPEIDKRFRTLDRGVRPGILSEQRSAHAEILRRVQISNSTAGCC